VTDRWTERLSEYLDGALEARDASDFESHLATCVECAATLEALRAVAARASALGPLEPARDLWPAIASRLAPRDALDAHAATTAPAGGQERRPGPIGRLVESLRGLAGWRLSLSLPQLAAASLALVLVSGGAAWMTLRRPSVAPPAPVAARPAAPAGAATVGLSQYDAAIAELERALAEHRAELDSSTVRVVEQNLAAIDRAIAEARRALAVDPTDPWLHDHLASTMRRKLGLLRRATEAAAYPT